ncbi:hypothetical protein N2W54_001014 [Lotmaria passim]
MVIRKSLATYCVASFVATALFLADYANTYRAFYPAMVALANSSTFRLVIMNVVVASAALLWFTMQSIFFGKLNASEEMALVTSLTVYLAECIFVPLYFDLELMSTTMVFFVFTLVWRLLHKLAAERVTTLSTVQTALLPIFRMVAYLNFVLILDVGLLIWFIQTRSDLSEGESSLHYSLLLIYMLLVTSTLRSAVRFGSIFVLHGHHTLLPFVADAITSIAESLLFVGVYLYIFVKATVPMLLARNFLSHALRIFGKASGLVEFVMLARKVRRDMPNATAEDLLRDARCTICYEDMVPGGGTKRLPCGHCYHTECLEHWLEGHSTCPYCRANIMRMPAGEAAHGAGDDAAAAAEADRPAAEEHRGEAEVGEEDRHVGAAADAAGQDAAAAAAAADPFPLPPGMNMLEERPANDPFVIRLRHFTAQHVATTTQAVEEDLRAAYQRYLNRVDLERAALDDSDKATSSDPAAEVKEKLTAKQEASPRKLSSPPAAQARSEKDTASPSSTPTLPAAATAGSVVADATSPLSGSTVSAASLTASSPPRTQMTVEQLKLKAYKKYHKRLREAERELTLALRQAEENGLPA